MGSNIKWAEAKINLRQQVVALDTAIRKKKDQDAELSNVFIAWWEQLLRRYGAHLARLLDAYKTPESLTTFDSIHTEEKDWHPTRIKIQETDDVGNWWIAELHYPNMGVEVTVSLSVQSEQKLNEEGIKLCGFDICLDGGVTDGDKGAWRATSALSASLRWFHNQKKELDQARMRLQRDMHSWWTSMLSLNGPRILYELQKSLGHPREWISWNQMCGIRYIGHEHSKRLLSASAYGSWHNEYTEHAFKIWFVDPDDQHIRVELSFHLNTGDMLTAERLKATAPVFYAGNQ